MGRGFYIFNKGSENHYLKLRSTHLFPEDQAPAEDSNTNPTGRTAGTQQTLGNLALAMPETLEFTG